MSIKKVSVDFHGRELSIEVGKVSRQANGSAMVRYGDTMVLVTAVCSAKDREGIDFLPLSVDYVERFSSAGKIPGGFFKREGRQTEKEVLTSRLIDRPLRPLFAPGYARETQVIATVLSYDKENDPDTLALIGASAALQVSDMPFLGPVSAVHVGRIDGQWVCNPKVEDREVSDIDLIVAGSKEAIVMVEGSAKHIAEDDVLAGLKYGYECVQVINELQDQLKQAVGKEKFSVEVKADQFKLSDRIAKSVGDELSRVLTIKDKMPRYQALRILKDKVVENLIAEEAALAGSEGKISEAFHDFVSSRIRDGVVKNNRRLDERTPEDIRQITVEVGVLPRAHGSALFTRGETQAIVTTTLGTSEDEQIIDDLQGDSRKHFLLHYNFPPFSVGEVKPLRGPGRREVGHGRLAHKAIEAALPSKEDFPYTIRVVSDVLESHGSSSMATVCGATLALMDAGVPLKAPIAGIAMGLVKEQDKFIVLSDISGDEDHIGDMDFKVAGSAQGITAVQMDIKVTGIGWDILHQALNQAKQGRLHILERMQSVIEVPRETTSTYAPRIETIWVDTGKIRDIIGTGGKVIRAIVEQSGAKVEIQDTGEVKIASADAAALEKARKMIMDIVAEPEVGKVYVGKITRVMEYGAFVEIMPGKEGLCHVSEFLTTDRIEDANDVVKEGDEMEVKVIGVEPPNRIRLSHREALQPGSSDSPRSGEEGGGYRPRPRPSGGRSRDRNGDRQPRRPPSRGRY